MAGHPRVEESSWKLVASPIRDRSAQGPGGRSATLGRPQQESSSSGDARPSGRAIASVRTVAE